MATRFSCGDLRRPLPDLAERRRLRRHERRSGLFGSLRRAERTIGRAFRAWTDVHDRPRDRGRVAAIEALAPHVVGATSKSSLQTSEVCGGAWSATPSSGGSARRRVSSTSRPPRSSTRLGSVREAGGQAPLEASRRHDARADRRLYRLPLHRGRPEPRRGAGDPASEREAEGRSRPASACRGVSGLYDLCRLAWLCGGEPAGAGPRGARRGVYASEVEGRRRPRE